MMETMKDGDIYLSIGDRVWCVIQNTIAIGAVTEIKGVMVLVARDSTGEEIAGEARHFHKLWCEVPSMQTPMKLRAA